MSCIPELNEPMFQPDPFLMDPPNPVVINGYGVRLNRVPELRAVS